MIHDPLQPPLCLAVDTNLLLLILAYQCLLLDKATPLERARVLIEIRARDDLVSSEGFDDLWRLFRAARRRIVTQHVIAETYGLRRRLASFRHRRELVWQAAIALLGDPGFEEQSCTVQDLYERKEYRPILIELGPTDAGLIHTAERQKATIVTDDEKLANWARRRYVRVRLFYELGPN